MIYLFFKLACLISLLLGLGGAKENQITANLSTSCESSPSVQFVAIHFHGSRMILF